MQYDLQALGFPLTDALREHLLRRLRFALTRDSQAIQRVTVRLGDTNGPRGGRDKFCRVQINLLNGGPVLVEEIGSDLYATIDRAAERTGRTVARRIDRNQDDLRRTQPGRPRRLPWRTGSGHFPRMAGEG